MQPLENGVPQRPFRPQAQVADTTVFTGLIPMRRGRRLFYNQAGECNETGCKKCETCIYAAGRNYDFGGNPPEFVQQTKGMGVPTVLLFLTYANLF